MSKNAMRKFMTAATPAEKEELARLADTSKGQLFQLVNGHRNCGPALAKRIEKGADRLRTRNPELPPLLRTDLCDACGACEYAKTCLAAK